MEHRLEPAALHEYNSFWYAGSQQAMRRGRRYLYQTPYREEAYKLFLNNTEGIDEYSYITFADLDEEWKLFFKEYGLGQYYPDTSTFKLYLQNIY